MERPSPLEIGKSKTIWAKAFQSNFFFIRYFSWRYSKNSTLLNSNRRYTNYKKILYNFLKISNKKWDEDKLHKSWQLTQLATVVSKLENISKLPTQPEHANGTRIFLRSEKSLSPSTSMSYFSPNPHPSQIKNKVKNDEKNETKDPPSSTKICENSLPIVPYYMPKAPFS